MSDKYRTIILHVGLHKTGTTSIQASCQFRHHDLLLRHGVKYASFRFMGKLRPNHSGPVTAALLDDPDQYSEEWRVGLGGDPGRAQQEFRRHFDQVLENPEADTLLLSGEIFSIFQVKHMKQLRKRLLRHAEQLRVLVYLRNPLHSIESMMEQRVRAGAVPRPDALVGLMKKRYLNLDKAFGPALEAYNFDDCASGPLGLVGSFLHTCGVPQQDLRDLEVEMANVRGSLEGYRIMEAINLRYPSNPEAGQTTLRQPRDTRPLYALPGARFGLFDDREAPWLQQARAEKHWFEERLGFKFKERTAAPPEETWGFDTLAELEGRIRELPLPELKSAALDFLDEEAGRLEDTRRDTATILRFIVRRLREIAAYPPPPVLREIGPAYFKAGATQVRQYSPELSLRLLRVVQMLQPDREEISKKIAQVERDLADSDG
jgi:hypothetical protein